MESLLEYINKNLVSNYTTELGYKPTYSELIHVFGENGVRMYERPGNVFQETLMNDAIAKKSPVFCETTDEIRIAFPSTSGTLDATCYKFTFDNRQKVDYIYLYQLGDSKSFEFWSPKSHDYKEAIDAFNEKLKHFSK